MNDIFGTHIKTHAQIMASCVYDNGNVEYINYQKYYGEKEE